MTEIPMRPGDPLVTVLGVVGVLLAIAPFWIWAIWDITPSLATAFGVTASVVLLAALARAGRHL